LICRELTQQGFHTMNITLVKEARRIKNPKGHLQDYPVAPLNISVTPSRYFRWKSFADFGLALLLLLPGLPLIAIAVALVRLTSRGPAIFRQKRVGRSGEIFCIYKVRSMRIDAEASTGPAWAQSADPRVTRIGGFLRRFHLDELPQLFNVLKGEMSLVGPRPERPEFVEVLHRQLPAYTNRLAVRPGVTGLAQLNLPPDSDLDSVHRKVILDIEYIQTANLWLDLRLILCTAFRFFKLPILRFFKLDRIVKLPARPVESLPSAAGESIVTLEQFQHKVDHGHSSNGNHDGQQIGRSRKGEIHSPKPK
jgi:lipopolysaccharide/colanic/teichoic acid biosynthesis glycosyltransferase